MDFAKHVLKLLQCSQERVYILEDASKFNLKAIEFGVVVIHAIWSGPSHVGLRAFGSALNKLSTGIPVWILNIDTLQPDLPTILVGQIGGGGEIFLIKNGGQKGEMLNFASMSGLSARWHELFDEYT